MRKIVGELEKVGELWRVEGVGREEGGSVMFVSTDDDGLICDSWNEERGPASESDVGGRICETVVSISREIATRCSAVVTTFLFLLGKLLRWGSMNPFPFIRLSSRKGGAMDVDEDGDGNLDICNRL